MKPRWLRLFAAAPIIVHIALVPLSRIYLGVHWPYDTVASLALGVALLAALLAAMKSARIERMQRATAPWFKRAAAVFCVAAAISAAVYARARLEREARPSAPSARAVLPLTVVRQQFPPFLKRNSEDLAGGPMEPAAFVFVGDFRQVVNDFARAGWSLADTPSASGLLHELGCVVRNAPDPHGPRHRPTTTRSRRTSRSSGQARPAAPSGIATTSVSGANR